MAKFKVTSPDGQSYEVNAPEGATEEEAINYAQQQFAPESFALPSNESMPGAYEGWESDARGYGARVGTSDVGYLANIAKTKMPKLLGGTRYDTSKFTERTVDGIEGYSTPFGFLSKDLVEKTNKRYDEFQALGSEEERRNYLTQQNITDAEALYPNLTPEMKQSGQALTGEVVGSIMSPTTLIAGPAALLGKGDKLWKAATKFGVLSGLWGGEYSALKQKAETGEIDAGQTAKDAAIGALAGGTLRGGAPLVYKGLKAGTDKTGEAVSKLVLKDKINVSAVEAMDQINVEAAKIIRNNGARDYLDKPGVLTKNGTVDWNVLNNFIKQDVAKKAGRTVDELKVIEKEAGMKFKVPRNESDAQEFISARTFDKYTNPEKNPFKMKLLQSISGAAVKTGRGVEKLITPSYELLKKYSPAIATKVQKMDFNILTKGNKFQQDTKVFIEQVANLDKANKNQLKKALSNGDFDQAKTILGNDVGFYNVRKTLEQLRADAAKAGIKIDKVEDYFPRYVKDHQRYLDRVNTKLRNQNSKQEISELSQIRDKLNRDIKKKYGRRATAEEQANEVNKYMQGQTKRKKSRVMMRINEELIDEYMDPIEALETYILNSINKTEKAKFFGNNARLSAGDGNQYIEDSIGALEESANLGARAPEVRQILRARLIDGEQGAGAMQTLKNISYMSFLSNPTAAATQLGDVGFSAAQNGFFRSTKNLMKQMGRQKFGDKLKYDIDEIGLGKNVSAEIGNTGKGMDKAVEKLFNLSGFTKVDRVGKNTSINSAYERAMDVLKLDAKGKLANPKQYQKFKNEWEGILGKDDFDSMVGALRNGRKTEDTKYYLFSELSKIQPISLSQMPVGYLTSKNGKIFYTLKSFALKQLDFARRKILNEIGRGEYKSAFKNTMVLSAALGGSQTFTDQIKKLTVGSPEEITVEDMPDEFVENLLKVVLLNKYSIDKLGKTKDAETFLKDLIAPPISPLFDVARDTLEYFDKPETYDEVMSSIRDPKVPFSRTRRLIPGVGRAYSEQTVDKPKRREKEFNEMMRQIRNPMGEE